MDNKVRVSINSLHSSKAYFEFDLLVPFLQSFIILCLGVYSFNTNCPLRPHLIHLLTNCTFFSCAFITMTKISTTLNPNAKRVIFNPIPRASLVINACCIISLWLALKAHTLNLPFKKKNLNAVLGVKKIQITVNLLVGQTKMMVNLSHSITEYLASIRIFVSVFHSS